ncbi:UNVERIFIED_CONTAM: hypothetical protein Sradi_4408900 [Sesamum radiatum]|uniref:Zinc finger PMZ-type domain-containing protein n=1 Tax=Sesamum radiatum TaxID=300843 RepID=A0AAW2NTE3_SESRA
MAVLQKWNPGTVVEWYHLDTDGSGLHMLNYVFRAFRPCIQGFRYCRNVISVDGTHLCTRYKHKLLVAVTLDANNQVLPLAVALVDEETLASWTWFLQMLVKYFLPGEDDRVCLISDRHDGLTSAINYVPAFKFPRGVHRFCLRHAEAIHHIVQKFDYNQQSASVITLSTTGQGSRTYVVKLTQQMYSCGKWGTHGIPCSHAIQASRHFGMNASNFIPQYFSTRAYKKTYQGDLSQCMGRSIGIPFILSLCIIRLSELDEDLVETAQREYRTKWIGHKHVPANNI